MKILSFFSLKSEFSHSTSTMLPFFYSEKCVFLYRLQLCFGYHLKKKVSNSDNYFDYGKQKKNENVLDYWYRKSFFF